MASLTDLPVEILTIIVRMAREQDECLKTRLRQSRERIVLPTKEVMKLFKWYGISLLALRATCKTLETVANPLVFESVRLSKCSHDIFYDSIIPKYSFLVKVAIFDCSPHRANVEDVAEFLSSLQDVPALRQLTFETCKSIEIFESLYKRAHGVKPPRETWQTEPRESKSGNRRYLRPLFASLSNRITHLVCLEVSSVHMEFLVRRFPNLRCIKRRLDSDYEETSDDRERSSYATLERLEELDLSTLTHQEEQDLRRAKYPAFNSDWDDSWLSQAWSTITTLNLSFQTLGCDEWKVLQSFRLPLKRLALSGMRVKEELWDLEEEAVAFPNLSTLRISGDAQLLTKVLRLLKLAPLSVLDVKLHSGRSISRDKLEQEGGSHEPHDDWHHFVGTLKCLKWNTFAKSYTLPFIEKLETFTEEKGIFLDFGKPEETQLFSDIREYETPSRETDDALPAPPLLSHKNRSFYGRVEEVLNLAAESAHNAFVNDDPATLNRLATLLRPLAAMQLMDRE